MKPKDFQERRALQLWEEGQAYHLDGDLDRALDLYDQSLAVCPTAEAHTFRGWALSVQGRLDEAIDECLAAIEVDPTMGNAYNDLVGMVSTDVAGMNRVEPGDPANSYLWHKLVDTHLGVGGSGTQMPKLAPQLSQIKLDTIEQWILDGALP